MEDVTLRLDEKGKGAFIIKDGEEQIGEMVIAISGTRLTVYHTEIIPKAEGKGLAKLLLKKMLAYAREHQLKVRPLCLYVLMQFKKNPELYSDIWETGKE
jgi:uncharacterized protein